MPHKIGWCDDTINPAWGCKNHCKYCYARDIANRFGYSLGKARGYWEVYCLEMKNFVPIWFPEWRIFFDKKVEAAKVCIVIPFILKDSIEDVEIRIFPQKSDLLEKSMGEFIFLPLFKGDVVDKKTVFLDNGERVYIQNTEDLSKIKLTSAEIFDTFSVLFTIIISPSEYPNRLFANGSKGLSRVGFTESIWLISDLTRGFSTSKPRYSASTD